MRSWSKKIAATCLAALLALGCAACGNKNNMSKSEVKEYQIVEDIAGNKVKLPKEIKKIAVVPIPWATVIFALDGGSSSRLTAIHPGAMSAYKGTFLEKIDKNFGTLDTKLINQNFSVNMEGLAAANIDSCLMWQYQQQDAEKLSKIGVKPVLIYNDTMDSLKKSFMIVGKMLNKEEKAQELVNYYNKAYDSIVKHKDEVKKAKKPKMLFLRNSQLALQGNDNFMHQILEISGADNPMSQSALDLALDKKTISMEEVYKINPDIIFLSNFDKFVPDDLYNNKIPAQDWSTVKAVKERRVYKVPMGIYRWDAPGVETPLMMRWLAKTLQPQIFSDVSIRQETKDFYKKFMGIDLTEADLAQIFADAANKNSVPLE